jgi:O-antigen/teichoic acid export membrane protein
LTSSRARRIFGGWSANIFGLILALTQQIVLIPLFLKYWSSATLAAWLAIFAAGMLVLTLDAGLHAWSLNRFLQFKSRADCDRRSRRFYGAMLRLYTVYAVLLVLIMLAIFTVATPSRVLGFSSEPQFDLSFAIMAFGTILMIPSNLATAVYRARGLYGRIGVLQAWGLAIGQAGQIVGVVTTGSLAVVTTAFVAGQLVIAMFLIFSDVYRRFPFLERSGSRIAARWAVAQFVDALPFSVANFVELGLGYLSVLLIGFFVSDRIAIAQWSLTRTIVNLLRQVSYQASLPIAAELGHDHAVGLRDSLQRLYVRGSVILVLIAATATSGALVFWPDFFAVWTHGAIPYDPTLSLMLLLGTCVATPALLAMSYAGYSNRGPLLLRAKSMQLALFVVLSLLLISRFGPMGAAVALVASELIAQSAFLATVIVGETLQRPVRYALVLLAMMVTIVAAGAALAETIGRLAPGGGLTHFVVECALWLAAVALFAGPLLHAPLRNRLLATLSRILN